MKKATAKQTRAAGEPVDQLIEKPAQPPGRGGPGSYWSHRPHRDESAERDGPSQGLHEPLSDLILPQSLPQGRFCTLLSV